MSDYEENVTEIFSEHFLDIEKSLIKIDSQLQKLRADNRLSVEGAAFVVKSLHAAKASFAMVYDAATTVLDELMADLPELELEDGTRIEKKIASDRRAWKHQNIAAEIARRLTASNVDMETGEIKLSTEELMAEMLRYLQPSYWRVKELSTIGINADNFCDVLEPKTSIIVRKAK